MLASGKACKRKSVGHPLLWEALQVLCDKA